MELKLLIIEKYYIINRNFMYMIGHYDRNGKLCSLVRELKRMFIVDRSPLEILSDSIKCIGFDLKGAISAAKWILGEIPMCPFMVNPIHNICVFPTKSAKNDEAMWFNPSHIIRTNRNYFRTNVTFKNGLILSVPCKLESFNNRLQNADQLRKITKDIGNDPISFIIIPKKEKLQYST